MKMNYVDLIRLGVAMTCGLATNAALAQVPNSPSAQAYYVAEFEPITAGAIQPYSERVEATFKPFGGRFIVRGGDVDSLEGDGPKGRLIIIAFNSLAEAQAWYRSSAYEEIKPIRHRAGKSNVYFVQGIPASKTSSAQSVDH